MSLKNANFWGLPETRRTLRLVVEEMEEERECKKTALTGVDYSPLNAAVKIFTNGPGIALPNLGICRMEASEEQKLTASGLLDK